MFSSSFKSDLKKIHKDLTTKVRHSERDQAPRYEIWHKDINKTPYMVRAWSELELKEELKAYGWGRILNWVKEAKKIADGNAQEEIVKKMQERNQARTDTRHKRRRDKLKDLASSTSVRNVFKELAQDTGL